MQEIESVTAIRKENPLAMGFYTIPEASRLIRVGSPQKIRNWLTGYHNRKIGPLLKRDFEPTHTRASQELSFLDLMEVRFVLHFTEHGVKAQSLRIAAEALRREFGVNHPYATDRVLLTADKADVFVIETLNKSAQEADDPKLRSLTTKNYVMYTAIQKLLLPGVEFHRESRLAKIWTPLPERFPSIQINPKRAFGRPIVPQGVPTEAIFDAWQAENQDYDKVARWFSLPSIIVKEAVDFERALDCPDRLGAP